MKPFGPYVYPIAAEPDKVQMEWEFGDQSCSLEICLSTGVGEWHRVDVSKVDGDSEHRTLNLRDFSDLWWLGKEIRRLQQEALSWEEQ